MKDTERNQTPGLAPGKWEDHFRKAKVRVEELDGARSAQSRATILGNFLSQNQGREVPVQVGDRSGRARLRVGGGDGKPRRYYFEIAWDNPPDSSLLDTPSTAGPAELDDGLGHTAAEEPGAAPPVPPAPPPAGEPAKTPSGGGHTLPDRETSANHEAWS